MSLKNESVVLVKCKVFSQNKDFIGEGYTVVRSNGRVYAFFGGLDGKALEANWYNVQHTEDTYLAVANWSIQ